MVEGQGHYPYQAPIDAYGSSGFRFADMSHKGSVLCLPTGMHAWAPVNPEEISLKTLASVLELADDLDVLFIGLGNDIRPIKSEIRDAFREKGVIVEAVATGSAISTYNILLGEQRAVAAALIAVEDVRRR